jgi:hypothetical protein
LPPRLCPSRWRGHSPVVCAKRSRSSTHASSVCGPACAGEWPWQRRHCTLGSCSE